MSTYAGSNVAGPFPFAEKCHRQSWIQIDNKHSNVDPRRRFAEHGHDSGVSQINPGKFMITRQAIRRDATKEQLTDVGVFAFVSFERTLPKPPANEKRAEHNQPEKQPDQPVRPGRCLAYGPGFQSARLITAPTFFGGR